MNISLKKGNYSWREQRKVHNKKEDPKGMDHYCQIREEVGLPDIEKKRLPDKEFNAPTKGEAKALLDDWKIKVAIQDAITSNIKIQDYANKYLFRKSLMVEAGKFKQTSLDRLEKLGQSSIVPFLGRRGIKITHTLFFRQNYRILKKEKA